MFISGAAIPFALSSRLARGVGHRDLVLTIIKRGVALLQLAVPVPGYGAGTFDPVMSINAFIDQLFLPGVLYGGTYDNEGLLNAISASSVTLSGVLAGGLLRMQTLSADRKTLLLAGFYYGIDVKSWNRGIGSYVVFFFTVIGLNSITIYMAARIFSFDRVSGFFIGWLAQPLGVWILVVGVIAVEWAFLYYLYKRRIFLKV